MMIEIIKTKGEALLSEPATLKSIIFAFSKIYKRKKLTDSNIDAGILEIVRVLSSNNSMRHLLETCGLTDPEQKFLKEILQ